MYIIGNLDQNVTHKIYDYKIYDDIIKCVNYNTIKLKNPILKVEKISDEEFKVIGHIDKLSLIELVNSESILFNICNYDETFIEYIKDMKLSSIYALNFAIRFPEYRNYFISNVTSSSIAYSWVEIFKEDISKLRNVIQYTRDALKVVLLLPEEYVNYENLLSDENSSWSIARKHKKLRSKVKKYISNKNVIEMWEKMFSEKF